MTTLPISAKDTIEFRPNAAAVIAAREALEKVKAEGGKKPTPEADAAIVAAQKAVDAAEEALATSDPVYVLKVPTGRSKALVAHAIASDPDAPKFTGNKELIEAVRAEAEDAGLTADEVSVLDEAAKLIDAGQDMPNDLWVKVYEACQKTAAGRQIFADRALFSELLARHRIRYHLVLSAKRLPLSERELDEVPHLAAINGELERLSTLTKDAAKNSAAP